VTLEPSVAIMLRLRGRAARHDPPDLLALGDPKFAAEAPGGATGEAQVYRDAFAANGGLPRLAGSAREAREVARFAPRAEVRLRAAASEAWLRRADLAGFRVLHFATHALVDEHSATRTALALAPGDGEDGFMGPGDLAALHLDADLVVLSACRTAGGVIVGGEGIQGLTAPLLQAGARAVLATEWPIEDRSTLAMVDDFYGGLADGLTADQALRNAQLASLRRGAAPAVWAAFTLVGDPALRIPLRRPATAIWWLAGGLLAVLLLSYGLLRMKRIAAERG
jgi:CHAT domain-containing protein